MGRDLGLSEQRIVGRARHQPVDLGAGSRNVAPEAGAIGALREQLPVEIAQRGIAGREVETALHARSADETRSTSRSGQP